MASRARLARGALLLAAAATLATLWLSAGHPQRAQAAPCPAPSYGIDGTGRLTIAGNSPCDAAPELISPFCSAGKILFDYFVNGVNSGGPWNTGIDCGAPKYFAVFGNGGDDTLDLSRVSAGNAFTGINQPNILDGGDGSDILIAGPFPAVVSGGYGNDVVFVRNGVHDVVDCGPGYDTVQTDQVGVDSLTNCEFFDFLPTPPVPGPTVQQTTGQRAAALKKCKHKHGRARAKCKKRANLLPV